MSPKQPLNVGNCFRRPAAPTPFEQPERLCSLRSSPAAFINIVMKTVQIKNITVGEGAPKIIVSLMAKDLAAVKSEAAAYAATTLLPSPIPPPFSKRSRRCAPLSPKSPFSSPSAPSTKAAKPN